MQHMPTVDVIMPAYNAEKYLPAAIESVMAQTYENWKIILVNDGSTDSTAAIAARYQSELGDRMLVITQKNGGMSAARNTAIRASSGEFLAMLDSDDVWLPCRLAESLKAFALRPNAGISYGQLSRIDETGRVLATFTEKQRHGEGAIAPYIYRREVELPCVTVTVRRRCIEEVGFFDETLPGTEDRDLWLRIAFRYEVAFVPEVIALYRTYPESVSADPERMLNAQLTFFRKHQGAPGCGRIARRIAIARAYKQRGEFLSHRGQPWQALLSSLHACWLWPFSEENLRSAASLGLKCARLR